jgi:membrane protease YdiL (CAAX protease family)
MTLRAATLSRGAPVEALVGIAVCVALAFDPIAASSVWILGATGVVAALGMTRIVDVVPVAPAVVALGLGVGVFAIARITGDGFGTRYTLAGIGVLVLAAIVEEAFFRGALHEHLSRAGLRPLLVGAVTTTLFALIHVPTYGAWVLPIDLAAGAVLAWQRHASGTWIVPAVTHAAANLMQLG